MQEKNKIRRKGRFIRLKYTILWYVGVVASFLLFFSGIIPIYTFLRKRYSKRYITIVLTYHRIDNGSDDRDISVSSRNFEHQIRYLKKNYDVISVEDLYRRLTHNLKINKDTVAITFDDGYRDNYTKAYPILKKYNIPATIFVIAGLIDNDPKMLDINSMLQMQKEGLITFGSHTLTHKVLAEADIETAVSEINNSKLKLERIIGEEVKFFAYPYGKKGSDFTEEVMRAVKDAGYVAAFSTDNGSIDIDDNLYALHRIGIRNFPLFVFKSRVSGFFESKLFLSLRKFLGIG